jgi:hypothetical protein
MNDIVQFDLNRLNCLQKCFLGGSCSHQQRPANFLYMYIVRAATSAKDIHFRMNSPDVNVLARQFIGVVFFEMPQLEQGSVIQRLGVTSRQVVWLFLEQLWFEFVPVLHGLQGRLAAEG